MTFCKRIGLSPCQISTSLIATCLALIFNGNSIVDRSNGSEVAAVFLLSSNFTISLSACIDSTCNMVGILTSKLLFIFNCCSSTTTDSFFHCKRLRFTPRTNAPSTSSSSNPGKKRCTLLAIKVVPRLENTNNAVTNASNRIRNNKTDSGRTNQNFKLGFTDPAPD